ncbi:MAG TPA: nicotinate-nucleotide adenylyltransferase [Tepidisphaeraceae bacterium]|jgi:nicotinate-nucleotide adenylyltransferase
MQTLFFGGSFNPIHHGHLICARAVAEAIGYEQVVLIPTGQSPHKPVTPELAPALDRLEMCRLAVTSDPIFEVNDIELKRLGASYTIDTVQELVRLTGTKPYWLIGADMLLYLPKWHRATELVEQTNFVVMARPGWNLDWQTLPPEFRPLQHSVVEAPMIDIRATDLRQRVASGRSIDYFTPPAVCAYIRDRGLYR